MEIVELELNNPPAGAIIGVPIRTVQEATAIFLWAVDNPGYACTLVATGTGDQVLQLDGPQSTVRTEIGGDRWIVVNNGIFEAFETSADALAKYKIKEQG